MCLNIITRHHWLRTLYSSGIKLDTSDIHHNYLEDGHPIAHTAGFNILAWKLLRLKNQHCGVSPYQDYQWTFGKQENAEFRVERHKVFQGLHAYLTKNRAEASTFGNRTVCPAVIPQGSKFYIGASGDIVATSMIVFAPGTEFAPIADATLDKHQIIR